MSGLHLHAGIVCLAFLAWDWLFLIGANSRVPVISLAMIGGYLKFVLQWDVDPITPNIALHIPPTVVGLLVEDNWHKMVAIVQGSYVQGSYIQMQHIYIYIS